MGFFKTAHLSKIAPKMPKGDFEKKQAERASLRDAVSQLNFKRLNAEDVEEMGLKKGGKVKAPSASKRADGCAQRGKTKGRFV
jgi:hypothetical protein